MYLAITYEWETLQAQRQRVRWAFARRRRKRKRNARNRNRYWEQIQVQTGRNRLKQVENPEETVCATAHRRRLRFGNLINHTHSHREVGRLTGRRHSRRNRQNIHRNQMTHRQRHIQKHSKKLISARAQAQSTEIFTSDAYVARIPQSRRHNFGKRILEWLILLSLGSLAFA